MCLVIGKNILGEWPTEQIAPEDLTVYKVGLANNKNKVFISMYTNYQYKKDTAQPKVCLRLIDLPGSGFAKVEKGYHSYTNYDTAESAYAHYCSIITEIRKAIQDGIDSYYLEGKYGKPVVSTLLNNPHMHPVLVNCTIPKGAKFYLGTGPRKEVVSSQISFNRVTVIDERI